jgi:hypothetical protein
LLDALGETVDSEGRHLRDLHDRALHVPHDLEDVTGRPHGRVATDLLLLVLTAADGADPCGADARAQ